MSSRKFYHLKLPAIDRAAHCEKNKSLILSCDAVVALLCRCRSSVLSRKRKLRELYAVARSAEPIPSHPGLTISTPFDDGEPHFLEANDLLQ